MTTPTLAQIQQHLDVPADGRWGAVTAAAIARAIGMASAPAKSGFDAALAEVLQHEGGFANHPRDPGGMTNLGVTRKTWEGWTGKPASDAEMRALTPETVAPLYRKNYWDALRCGELPAGLALCVFDFGVNAGPNRAARYLQRLVGTAEDGKIGPATIAAAATTPSRTAVSTYQDMRRGYYRQLPTFAAFGRGWLRRVDEVERAALELAQ